MNNKFILFVNDHCNSLGMVRSLGEIGINPIVILVAINPYLVNKSKYVTCIHTVTTKEEGLSVLLNKYGNELQKPFILTGSDSIESLLDCHYDELKDKFYFFNGGKQGQITHFMNKDIINQLAVECGFSVLKTEVVDRGILPKFLRYPVITKSIMSIVGGWKNDVFICKDEQELLQAYEKIKSPIVLVQEYILKKNELCIDGFSINGGQEIFIPFQTTYIRFSSKSYGNYMKLQIFDNPSLIEKLRLIIKKTGFSGLFEVEFLIDENDCLFFLEVNFRNSAWGYISTYGGANLPYLWAESTLLNKIDISNLKLRASFTAMSEIGDFVCSVVHADVSLWKWIKDVRTCNCLLFFNSQDKKPFFSMILNIVKLQFLRFIKSR